MRLSVRSENEALTIFLSSSFLSCSAEDVWGERGTDASGEPGSGGWEAVLNVRIWPQAVCAEDGAADETKRTARGWGKSFFLFVCFLYSTISNTISATRICDISPLSRVSCLQVKSLRIQGEQESSKRVLVQSDLKSRLQEVDRLRCSEKQLKQEINTALESKRSLEFQLAQLTKWVAFRHEKF